MSMKIIVNGLVVNYTNKGSGETVLFLHGWQDNLTSFDELADRLVNKRIIKLDLPGFGGSETPKDTWDISDYAAFVANFLKKLGLTADVVVGHSFGGRIIIKAIAEKEINPSKAVLIASAGIAKNKTLKNRTIKTVAKVGKAITFVPPLIFFKDKIRRKLYTSIGSDYLDSGDMKQIFLRTINEDLSLSAKKISCPVLLIWGAHDNSTPLKDGEKMSQLISDSKLVVVPDTGHFVHRQNPDKVANEIKEFLER